MISTEDGDVLVYVIPHLIVLVVFPFTILSMVRLVKRQAIANASS